MPSPQFEAALAAQADYKEKLAGATSLDEIRRLDASEIPKWSGELPSDVKVEEIDAGGVPSELLTPSEVTSESVFIYAHGGGFCLGSPATVRVPVAKIIKQTGGRAILPDYRLSPEHLYPAHVDDIIAVYRWVLDQGTAANNVVISGESAGGGLIAAVVVAIRDQGLPAPAGAVPISPQVDFEFNGASWETNSEKDGFVSKALALQNVPVFLGPDQDPGAVSPTNADLTGLPPLFVPVGGAECILDDSKTYVTRAKEQGVDAELKVYPDMVHLWHVFGDLPEADEALTDIADFVTARVAG